MFKGPPRAITVGITGDIGLSAARHQLQRGLDAERLYRLDHHGHRGGDNAALSGRETLILEAFD
jgi:hypothetical protein